MDGQGQDRPLYADFGDGLKIGEHHYRAWVGPPAYYDLIGAWQFATLTLLGMRETSTLLDIGCGSLRGGRFSITYLRPGNYFGLEPNEWAVADGIEAHFGKGLAQKKRLSFIYDDNFTLSRFNRKFDFLVAHSIFTHAAKRQIERCLEESTKVMARNSVFLATFHESENEYVGADWVYPGISQYRKETITSIVEGAGMACHHLNWPHPFDQKWFVVVRPDSELNTEKLLAGYTFSHEAFLERKRAVAASS